MTDRGKLFAALPPPGPDEHFDTLLEHPAARIERIVSHGHASPPDFWYDQPGAEWVMLVRGRAELAFDDSERLALTAGDWTFIPPHRRHRVEWTSADAIWLAVHLAAS